MADDEMIPGEMVRVRLAGDDLWYKGVVLDRPRKQWVDLLDYGREFIADENCIVEWDRVIGSTGPTICQTLTAPTVRISHYG